MEPPGDNCNASTGDKGGYQSVNHENYRTARHIQDSQKNDGDVKRYAATRIMHHGAGCGVGFDRRWQGRTVSRDCHRCHNMVTAVQKIYRAACYRRTSVSMKLLF